MSDFLLENIATDPEDIIVDDTLASNSIDLSAESDDETINLTPEEIADASDTEDVEDFPEDDEEDLIEIEDSDVSYDDDTEIYSDEDLDDEELLDVDDMKYDDYDDIAEDDFLEAEARRANADIMNEAANIVNNEKDE